MMMLIFVIQIYRGLFTRQGRRRNRRMLPRYKDIEQLLHNIAYLLGIRSERVKIYCISYLDKFEYFFVLSGMLILIITGLIIWEMYYFPKFYVDVADAIHLGEATLFILVLIVGHIGVDIMNSRHTLWYRNELLLEDTDKLNDT